MTTLHYRQRQRDMNAATDRLADYLVAGTCLAITAYWAYLIVMVLL